MLKQLTRKQFILPAILMAGFAANLAMAQGMAKSQVGNLIKQVEDGTDKFRDYLEKKGETAKDSPAANGGQTPRGRTATDTQKNNARAKKDALKDSLDELNKSTNKLRRKFDGTDNWITTKKLVETVVEDGRKVNTSLTKGNYGTEAARLWGVLRGGINDLARAYGVTPLGA
jgi:TATA-binding protein-associated factor Taf7